MSDSNKSVNPAIARTIGLEDTRRGKKRWIKWLIAAFVLVLAILGGVLWLDDNNKNAPRFRTEEVRRGDLTVSVSATGNLAPTNEVEVGSELSGIVQTVLVDFNDTVAVGQPLARLDSTKFEAVVMQSRAALASARARHQQAQATLVQKAQGLQRLRQAHTLSGGRAPSAADLEAAEADLERAKADVAAAAAAIDQAGANLRVDETNLSKTTIVSPINGTVLQRNVDPGQTVAASLQAPVLFILAEDLARMELRVAVDEADVGQVRQGLSASFTVDAYPDRIFDAHITQVRYGSQITDGVVTYTTLLDVANPDLLLRPGMTATADIIIHQFKDALLAPNAALRFRPPEETDTPRIGGRGVMGVIMPGPPMRGRRTERPMGPAARRQRLWVIQNNQPEPIAVTTGPTDGIFTVITDGDIQPGLPVIVGSAMGRQ